jgi:hypothetical protein
MEIKRGATFTHARQITGSPKAGTARPVLMEITAVRRGSVYYRPAGTTGSGWVIERDRLDSIILTTTEGKAS